ncbi:MAG: hypothetical protein DMG55_32660 [Acidobacteria bacterium]|nr:MAG: hypothetical protein DMG55_32660 [Acidobacteriota bacterium]
MFLPVAVLPIRAYPDSLVVAPSKRRIEAAFIGCVDVDWPPVMKGVLQLLVGFVSNELEIGRGFT